MPRTALAATLVLLAALSAAAVETIPWTDDVPRALEGARAGSHPVLADVWAAWCGPCKVMERVTWSDARVIDAVGAGFVPLKVDADANDPFASRYRVEILPTTLVLDPSGREITRLVGLTGPDEMLATLSRIREGYDAYLEEIGRPDRPASLRAAAAYLSHVGNPAGAARLLKTAVGLLVRKDPASAERTELDLAQAQYRAGDERQAVASLERLSERAEAPAVRGDALVAIVRMERERGHDAAARRAFDRLRAEFPDLASGIE